MPYWGIKNEVLYFGDKYSGFTTKEYDESSIDPRTEHWPWRNEIADIKQVKIYTTFTPSTLMSFLYECSFLTSVDLTGINTSNVTDMSWMFYHCGNLTDINFGDMDTSNVTNMGWMFYKCESLTSIDVTGFDTSNVTNMGWMFNNCRSLTSIDLSGFDTSNVEDMERMFYNCESLTSIDVTGFDTSNVRDMNSMFNSCTSLTSIDVTGFDTSNVKYMDNMFNNCTSLTSIDIGGFYVGVNVSMNAMFLKCWNLTSVVLEGLRVDGDVDMSNMFNYCTSLTHISFNNVTLNGNVNMSYMFKYCSALTSVDFKGIKVKGHAGTSTMFEGCTSLDITSVNLDELDKKPDLGIYIGVDGVAKKISSLYVGVDNVAHGVNKAYIGVNNVARLFYTRPITYFLPEKGTPLSEWTWEQIGLIADSDLDATEYFGTGPTGKDIILSTGEIIPVHIGAFYHNTLYGQDKKATFAFVFSDCLKDKCSYSSASNRLADTASCFPPELRAILKHVYYGERGDNHGVLRLPSLIEMNKYVDNASESGKPYKYFGSVIKKVGNNYATYYTRTSNLINGNIYTIGPSGNVQHEPYDAYERGITCCFDI